MITHRCPRCSLDVPGWLVYEPDGFVYCVSCGFIVSDPGKVLADGLLDSLMRKRRSECEYIWAKAREARKQVMK